MCPAGSRPGVIGGEHASVSYSETRKYSIQQKINHLSFGGQPGLDTA